MPITMDGSGRIVVPRAIRGEAGLRPGVPLVIRCRGGRVEIEARPRQVRIARRGRVAVAEEAGDPSGALEERTVARTRDALRGGR